MCKKIIVTVIFGLIAVISVFFGIITQKNYNEKYVHTKAKLIYEEKRSELPSDFTYLYSADGRNYNAIKTGGFRISKRNISYNKALPSDYYFGHIAMLTKVLFFIGTIFIILAVYFVFGVIFYFSVADKILPCLFLYYVAGIAFLTESELITMAMAFFTLVIIIICVKIKKENDNNYYY